MLFNSFEFLLFFPVVTVLYFLLPQRVRWIHLLAASCVFYCAFIPAYLGILAVTIAIDYTAARIIERSEGPARRFWLVVSVVSTCLVLAIFKYFAFVDSNLAALARALHLAWSESAIRIVLPIGLSFHTFQSLSYVVEVYRGRQKAEAHFGLYSLYVMFYPQLVAGPIERPQHLLGQFRERHEFDDRRVVDGLRRMAWGMFKKVVIADRLAILVSAVYDAPGTRGGPALLLATIFFAFQIYCDFSGYSDIALGSAEVMGFRLMTNFDVPYGSTSIREFWTRWHISLSTWFRDYLYIPLGGNRVGAWRRSFNVAVTFLVSGLWHGANWTFVIWGALHGLFLLAGEATSEARKALRERVVPPLLRPIATAGSVVTTFALVSFAWIFFRSASVADAFDAIVRMTTGLGRLRAGGASDLEALLGSPLGLSPREIALAILLIVFLVAVERRAVAPLWLSRLSLRPVWLRWPVYYAFLAALLVLGVFGRRQFIYFQF